MIRAQRLFHARTYLTREQYQRYLSQGKVCRQTLYQSAADTARDLAQVITDDQVLTARLLRLVNSSFYGFPQRITTITRAIVLLGFDAIRHLLHSIPYDNKDEKIACAPDPLIVGSASDIYEDGEHTQFG